jgi:hypothetical protein
MDGSIEPEALIFDCILLIGSDTVQTSKGCEMEDGIWDRAFYDDGEWVS